LSAGSFRSCETTLSVSWTVSESNSGTLATVASDATVSAAGPIETIDEGMTELCAVATATQAEKRVNDFVNILKIKCCAARGFENQPG
jgi:hypothetical protein